MVDTAAVIWDDYNTTGVPGSGAKLPVKSKIREWGALVEGAVLSGSATRTALKALNTTLSPVAYLKEAGREGAFVWRSGDYAARIAADTQEGLYLKADAVAATVGAWVRAFQGAMELSWFGMAASETAANNTAAFDGFMAVCVDGDGAHGVIPPGAFECNSLVVSKSGVRLSGQGYATQLINATTDQPCVKIKGASIRYHCTVEKMRFGQKSGVTPVAGNCAILIDDADDCRLDDIIAVPYPAALRRGIVLVTSTNTVLRNLYVAGCLNDGYHFSGVSEFAGGDLAAMANGGSGFVFNGVSGVYADHLIAYGNTGSAFIFLAGATNQYVHGTGWIGDTSGTYNWNIANLNRSVFNVCWGATQLDTGVNTFATGLIITSADCFDISFENSQFHYNNSHGVQITGSAFNIRLNNCQLGGQTGNGRSGVGSGLRIELATHVSVHGCRSYGNASEGIVTTAVASDYLSIIGNDFQGNTGAAVNFGHTGTNTCIHSNLGNTNAPFGTMLQGTATFDPASLADGVGATTTVTVTGAALGDVAMASFSLATSGITITAWVSAANTVSVRFQNESGGVLDIGSGTLKAVVLK